MTQEEKDILLEKMLDSAAVLTDEQLKNIMHDGELREIYDVSAALRGACVQPSEIDVEKEWRLFRHKILPKPFRWRWVMRVAAIFLGVMFVSAIVKVAVDRLLTPDSPLVAEVSKPKNADLTVISQETESPQTGIDQVENCELDAPAIRQVSKQKGRKLRPIAQEQPEPEDIDVDEYLRLQQARIDNDLALLQARIYIEELEALESPMTPNGGGEEFMPLEVRYVIMQ